MGAALVYLLRFADDSLYCGWTTDIQRRLAAHRPARPAATRAAGALVEVAVVIPVADRFDAVHGEAHIKRLPRATKLRLISMAKPPMPNAS